MGRRRTWHAGGVHLLEVHRGSHREGDGTAELPEVPAALDARRWRVVEACGFVVGAAPTAADAEALAASLEAGGADVVVVAPERRPRHRLVVGGATAGLAVAAGVAATAWRLRHRTAA